MNTDNSPSPPGAYNLVGKPNNKQINKIYNMFGIDKGFGGKLGRKRG